MAESEKAGAQRLEKWREKRRLKRERTGDSPQKQAERQKPQPSVNDEMQRAVGAGFVGGGIP